MSVHSYFLQRSKTLSEGKNQHRHVALTHSARCLKQNNFPKEKVMNTAILNPTPTQEVEEITASLTKEVREFELYVKKRTIELKYDGSNLVRSYFEEMEVNFEDSDFEFRGISDLSINILKEKLGIKEVISEVDLTLSPEIEEDYKIEVKRYKTFIPFVNILEWKREEGNYGYNSGIDLVIDYEFGEETSEAGLDFLNLDIEAVKKNSSMRRMRNRSMSSSKV